MTEKFKAKIKTRPVRLRQSEVLNSQSEAKTFQKLPWDAASQGFQAPRQQHCLGVRSGAFLFFCLQHTSFRLCKVMANWTGWTLQQTSVTWALETLPWTDCKTVHSGCVWVRVYLYLFRAFLFHFFLCFRHRWKTVLEAFCNQVYPSVSEWVSAWVCASRRPCEHHFSQKSMKGISSNFGHRCSWVGRCGGSILESKVKVTAVNDQKTSWTPYLTNQWRDFHQILVTYVFGLVDMLTRFWAQRSKVKVTSDYDPETL